MIIQETDRCNRKKCITIRQETEYTSYHVSTKIRKASSNNLNTKEPQNRAGTTIKESQTIASGQLQRYFKIKLRVLGRWPTSAYDVEWDYLPSSKLARVVWIIENNITPIRPRGDWSYSNQSINQHQARHQCVHAATFYTNAASTWWI